jgi:hypothetical protein
VKIYDGKQLTTTYLVVIDRLRDFFENQSFPKDCITTCGHMISLSVWGGERNITHILVWKGGINEKKFCYQQFTINTIFLLLLFTDNRAPRAHIPERNLHLQRYIVKMHGIASPSWCCIGIQTRRTFLMSSTFTIPVDE